MVQSGELSVSHYDRLREKRLSAIMSAVIRTVAVQPTTYHNWEGEMSEDESTISDN